MMTTSMNKEDAGLPKTILNVTSATLLMLDHSMGKLSPLTRTLLKLPTRKENNAHFILVDALESNQSTNFYLRPAIKFTGKEHGRMEENTMHTM